MSKELLEIHVIDLKEEVCEKCGKKMYPAIFSSALGYWDYSYVCDKCILKTGYITNSRLKEIKESYVKSLGKEIVVDTSWVNDKDKKEILDYFLKLEDEDKEYIKDIDLYKAHIFKDNINKGGICFSEQEMFDYFDFYGNDVSMVKLLRNLALGETVNKFFKGLYIQSRKGKLTPKQLKALKRKRMFKNICEDTDEFWDCLPVILDYLERLDAVDDWDKMIESVIKTVMEYDFYTKNQRYVIDKYIQERILIEA